MAGELAAALRSLLDATAQDENGARILAGCAPRVRSALAEWDNNYCRPTCRWRDDGECHDVNVPDFADCGCPCGHGEEDQPEET